MMKSIPYLPDLLVDEDSRTMLDSDSSNCTPHQLPVLIAYHPPFVRQP